MSYPIFPTSAAANRKARRTQLPVKLFLGVGLALLFSLGAVAAPKVVIMCAGEKVAECADIPAAQMRLRELKRGKGVAGPVEVVLPDGTYFLNEPLRFAPIDSGTAEAPVTYRAETAGAVTISGGMRIRGWKSDGKGGWQVEIPRVKAGEVYFRQLFVNGRRAIRARSPNVGFHHTVGLIKRPEHKRRQADGFYFSNQEITREMVADPDLLLTVYQSWLAHQYRVKELDLARKAVVTEPMMDVMRLRSRFIVENVPQCLDAPGEWYLDRQTGLLRYFPRPGERLATVEAIAPTMPFLLQFKGDPEGGSWIEHLHFQGIRFAHADWSAEGRSVSSSQANHPTFGKDDPDIVFESAAISALGLRHSSFENCEVTQTGVHAITFLQGCSDNVVRKCHLHDLGGGGVYLFWQSTDPKTKRRSWKPQGAFEHIERNAIDNCYIHDYSKIFHGSVGIITGPCAAYNRITHNEVSYGDYTGISIGWGWSANKKYGFHQDGNIVEYNHVHHVMNHLLDDGGAIYLLGNQHGAKVRYNWLHDICHDPLGHGAKGIYPDQGTAGVLFEGNIVHDVQQGFGGNGGHECIVRDNIFVSSGKSGVIGGSKWWGQQVRYNKNPIVFERNIVYQEGCAGIMMKTGYSPAEQRSSNNIYWPGKLRLEDGLFSGKELKFANFGDWQKGGHDAGSVMSDPLFVDVAKRDLRLRPDSPALKMGFKQTDRSKIGLYGDADWVSLPRRTAHPESKPLPGPGAFVWDYETETVGSQPVCSGVMVPGPEELGHKIEVTSEDPAGGRHCLKLVEGKNETRNFFPFIHYPVGVLSGKLKATLKVKFPAASPSAFYLSFRDYNNTGSYYFQTGPRIEINPQGVLTCTPGAKVEVALPRDVWIPIELKFSVGPQSPKTFDLGIILPGADVPRKFAGIPFQDAGFKQVGDLYLVSIGPDGGIFFVDDLRIEVDND